MQYAILAIVSLNLLATGTVAVVAIIKIRELEERMDEEIAAVKANTNLSITRAQSALEAMRF